MLQVSNSNCIGRNVQIECHCGAAHVPPYRIDFSLFADSTHSVKKDNSFPTILLGTVLLRYLNEYCAFQATSYIFVEILLDLRVSFSLSQRYNIFIIHYICGKIYLFMLNGKVLCLKIVWCSVLCYTNSNMEKCNLLFTMYFSICISYGLIDINSGVFVKKTIYR